MRTIMAVSLFIIAGITPALHAAEPIPSCRYDNSLIPIVKQAVDWAIADFRAKNVSLPFERVVYNTSSGKDTKVLSVHLVKDATQNTVNSNGCIVDRSFQIGMSSIKTDGNCIPTDRSKCTSNDDAYMQERFIDIHGKWSDRQTGYEMTGACYMTNLQACTDRDRLELLKILGPRDKLSVKGVCVADATLPMTISCSAGALKMLLSREAAKELAPTIGILFVLSHELAHLSKQVSSRYDVNDYTVDRAWPAEDKFAVLRNMCRVGNALRGQEQSADELAVMAVRRHVKEISDRWPKQGTVPWLVSQAGHFSTNLVRWNNDWHDGVFADMPNVFRQQADNGMLVLNSKDMEYLDKDEVPSGFSEAEIRSRSTTFLCELAQKQQGKWMILIQSGTTHGTMVERLASVIGGLRTGVGESGDSVARAEDMIGRVQDLVMRRHRAYLRELEAEICDLVDQPIQCPADTPKPGDGPTLAAVESGSSVKQAPAILSAPAGKTDTTVTSIWVRFVSKAGKAYKAVHVFQHPKGPYILLSSKDKDVDDFRSVEALLSGAYKGIPEETITDRLSDICIVIKVPSGFTQGSVVKNVDTFFKNTFSKVAIEAVY
jgi:hypothetical protein